MQRQMGRVQHRPLCRMPPHIHGLDSVRMSDIPPLEDDRTAMMLGLVPDKRTPEERLLDAIRTNGESLKYRYEPRDTPTQEGNQ